MERAISWAVIGDIIGTITALIWHGVNAFFIGVCVAIGASIIGGIN